MTDFSRARANMVHAQLQTNGITDSRVIDAYLQTPRETYVTGALAGRAYLDDDVRLPGTQRWLLEPLVEARLMQAALTGRVDRALVLGAASVPTIAVLASFAQVVTVLEPSHDLALAAATVLAGFKNVGFIETSLREGYPRQAPYDVIFATGALAHVSSGLTSQLAEGGRLVAVVRSSPHAVGRVTMVRACAGGACETLSLADALVPYLEGFEPEKGFVFK